MNLFLTSVVDAIDSIPSLRCLINEKTKLIVLPFAHDFKWLACAEDIYNKYDRDPKAEESIFYRTVRPFVDLGIDYNNIVIINHFADPVPLIKQKLLADNTIVYLPGGRPENIMKILRKLGLTNTIKKCKTVVGESAGAMIWSRHFFVYPDRVDYSKYRCYRGLGITKNCVIIPHYVLTDYKEQILRCCHRFSLFHRDIIRLVQDGGWVHYDTKMNKIIDSKKTFRY